MVNWEKFRDKDGLSCCRMVRLVLEAAGIRREECGFEAEQLVRMALEGADPRLAGSLSEGQVRRLALLCRRRCLREPLQYLAGRWPFMNMELEVGPGVLIPREDTEVLCLAAADCARSMGARADEGLAAMLGGWQAPLEAAAVPAQGEVRILDLCAGTGCVGLGICSLLPDARVTAVEKSEAAWKYLCSNTQNSRVTPVQSDVFRAADTLPGGVWVLAANPPYISEEEMLRLDPEVKYEPVMALLAGDGGLAFYRCFVKEYRRLLAPGGWMVFEIGARQGDAVQRLLREAGAEEVRLLRDGAGRPRVVRGRFA